MKSIAIFSLILCLSTTSSAYSPELSQKVNQFISKVDLLFISSETIPTANNKALVKSGVIVGRPDIPCHLVILSRDTKRNEFESFRDIYFNVVISETIDLKLERFGYDAVSTGDTADLISSVFESYPSSFNTMSTIMDVDTGSVPNNYMARGNKIVRISSDTHLNLRTQTEGYRSYPGTQQILDTEMTIWMDSNLGVQQVDTNNRDINKSYSCVFNDLIS